MRLTPGAPTENCDAKPERSKKKNSKWATAARGLPFFFQDHQSALAVRLSQRSSLVVAFLIRTLAGEARSKSRGGTGSTVAARQPRSRRASRQDLREREPKLITVLLSWRTLTELALKQQISWSSPVSVAYISLHVNFLCALKCSNTSVKNLPGFCKHLWVVGFDLWNCLCCVVFMCILQRWGINKETSVGF